MRLMRLGPVGSERPIVRLDEHHYVDVSDRFPDFGEAFFSHGMPELRSLVAQRSAQGQVHSFAAERVGAPVARPHQILCIGLNYVDHANETRQDVPSEPLVFSKSPNTMIGPDDDVRLPRTSVKTDWEVELGVVIGQRTSYLSDEAAAIDSIAGYVLVNDVSERAFQLERGGQWIKGKSAETFNPTGPWLATPDDLPPLDAVNLWLKVDGQSRQAESTAAMIFSPAYLVFYLSQFMVLEPGDLVNTGTPPGVGMGMDPPQYLQAGQVITLGGDGLGTQRQNVIVAR